MARQTDWAFPANLQPDPADVRFDLDAALDAVVMLRSEIPEDAFTAGILGTERVGNGVVIREDGLVLTIGYLTTEAQSIWLTTNGGKVVPGHPLAYDQATGFGLVMPLGKLDIAPLTRGTVDSVMVGDDVFFAGAGGRSHALRAKVVAKREFAGYWEYVLDEALFTAPAHPQWGGGALIGENGRLLGIGSLLVQEALQGQEVQGNMVVPIDLLAPILDDMLTTTRAGRAPRPWLGMYVTEFKGHLVIGGLADDGPAERAGAKLGDIVAEIAGDKVTGLAQLFRRIWSLGDAGVDVPLVLQRDRKRLELRVRSADRNDFLKKPQLH
jgi:S1-C subfamily serine protease